MWFNVDGELVERTGRVRSHAARIALVVGKRCQNCSMQELAEISREMRAAGKKLVVTNGCFDLACRSRALLAGMRANWRRAGRRRQWRLVRRA